MKQRARLATSEMAVKNEEYHFLFDGIQEVAKCVYEHAELDVKEKLAILLSLKQDNMMLTAGLDVLGEKLVKRLQQER